MWRRDSGWASLACLDNSCFYKRFNSVSSIWWCFCVLWETSVSMFGLFHGRRQTKSHEIMWLILVTLGSVFARPGLTWRFHVTWRLIISNTRLFHGSIKRLCDGRLHKEALILQQSARQQQPKKTTIGCWSKHLLLSHGFCFLLCSSRSFCRTQAFSDGCGSGVEQSPSHGTGGSIPAPPVMCRREAEWGRESEAAVYLQRRIYSCQRAMSHRGESPETMTSSATSGISRESLCHQTSVWVHRPLQKINTNNTNRFCGDVSDKVTFLLCSKLWPTS